jgi:hypothetical protein
MRIRQTKSPPVRSSLRELPGTAQVFAKPGEPVPASSLLLSASRRTALSQRNHGSAYAKATADKLPGCHGRTFELRHTAFGLRHFPNNSHRKFPPNNFPGRPLLQPLDSTPPVMMAMGIGPPQTTIKTPAVVGRQSIAAQRVIDLVNALNGSFHSCTVSAFATSYLCCAP